jgi:DNA-binding CsgD family transcriptional regulator
LVVALANGHMLFQVEVVRRMNFEDQSPSSLMQFEAELRTRYKLTPAEARLAAFMAGGARLVDAAAELGIAKETARTQLRAIFAKTRTGRQAALVALMASIRPRNYPKV